METRQIKCPWCSAVLTVKYQPEIESKVVTCPICKRQSPYAQFKAYIPPSEDHTCYPTLLSGVATQTSNNSIGQLFVPSIGASYDLSPGDNIIGRKAASSNATIGIETPINKRISREHIVINVSVNDGRGLLHTLSLYKEKLNPTALNGNPLSFGDQVVLKHGDVINLPDMDVIFQIPDPDMTEI